MKQPDLWKRIFSKKIKKYKCLNCQTIYLPERKGKYLLNWDESCPNCKYICFEHITIYESYR